MLRSGKGWAHLEFPFKSPPRFFPTKRHARPPVLTLSLAPSSLSPTLSLTRTPRTQQQKIHFKPKKKKKTIMSAHRRTRSRWQPPPPPTPKILHLPRRIRLHRPPVPARPAPALSHPRRNLLSLFIKEQNTNTIDRTFESKEKRTAEAAPLRAECNFLRIERDAALQKLEKTRVCNL